MFSTSSAFASPSWKLSFDSISEVVCLIISISFNFWTACWYAGLNPVVDISGIAWSNIFSPSGVNDQSSKNIYELSICPDSKNKLFKKSQVAGSFWASALIAHLR